MKQLPRHAQVTNGYMTREFPFIAEEPAPHRHSVGGVADLIDLSVDIDVSNLGKGNTVNFPPSTMQDLITF